MLEAICPACDSLRTEFDSDAREEAETGHCRDCNETFALKETVTCDRSVWIEVAP